VLPSAQATVALRLVATSAVTTKDAFADKKYYESKQLHKPLLVEMVNYH